MNLDGFISMPTFRPDGRLDTLHKGKAEKWEEFTNLMVTTANQKKKPPQRPAVGGAASSPRPAPRPQASAPIQEATVGNRVRAKRGGSLLGSFGTGTGY